MALFRIMLELGDGSLDINYETLNECLSDCGLRALFDEGLVTRCTVSCHGKRIAGLPVLTWDRLSKQVVSNSTALLQCNG